MDTKDGIFFSPKIRMQELNLDKDTLIAAFEDRIKGYYLDPIKSLNDNAHAFAAGILEFALIDALARYYYDTKGLLGIANRVRVRMKKMLKLIFPEINRKIANNAYYDFRNGLLHESRIKNCGQFSYLHPSPFVLFGKYLKINTLIVHVRLEKFFNDYIDDLNNNKEQRYDTFFKLFKKDFEKEIKMSKKVQ
ncbi:MAG: hypothetical protein LBR18_08780 [Tannerella sp.]|jgi:lipoate-protein ligase A|nr:hypothetical protein [Tannerella sp.]